MPLPYDPEPLAAPLPNPIELVENDEDLDFTSLNDGQTKPALNAIRHLELHAALDSTAAGALGDPDDSNRGTFIFSGEVQFFDNGSDVSILKIRANTTCEVQADGLFHAKSGSNVTIDPGANVAIDVPDVSSVSLNGGSGVSRTRVVGRISADPADWTIDYATGHVTETNPPPGTPSPKAAYIFVEGHEIPHGVAITDIYVQFQAGAGHTGLPGVMPTITAVVYDITTGNSTGYTPVSDASANVTAYKTVHDIHATGAGKVPAGTWDASKNRLVIVVTSEYGTSPAAGNVVSGARIAYTQTTLDT